MDRRSGPHRRRRDAGAGRRLGGASRLAFESVGHALQAGGATSADVVKLTIFVVDLTGLPAIRAVRDEFVDVQRPPTSSLVQVAALFHPEVLIEVEAVACVAG